MKFLDFLRHLIVRILTINCLNPLEATNTTQTVYGEIELKQLRKTKVIWSHKGKGIKYTFYMTDLEKPKIIGLNSCKKLKLLSVNYTIDKSKRIYKNIP